MASLGYKGAGFGGETTAPAHSDSAAGQALLTKHFPSSTSNPTNIIFKLKPAGLGRIPAVLARGRAAAVRQRAVHQDRRAARPDRMPR